MGAAEVRQTFKAPKAGTTDNMATAVNIGCRYLVTNHGACRMTTRFLPCVNRGT
jgi:hypothetical protein